MALHNSFKQGQSQQQGTRLAAVPTTEDLTYALAQAGKSGKNPVVISWKSSKTPIVFWLSVTAGSGGTEVEWLLQKGEENAQPKDVWNHKTADTKLIQNLVAAEDQMALKSGSKVPTIPSLEELNQQRDNSPGNQDWTKAGSNPNTPIVLAGGFQSQPQRNTPAAASPPQWQGGEVSGWNAPQPAPEQLGWGQKAVQQEESTPSNTPSNPFAALKATAEEPKPVNPFNALMSNQSLPQLPMQEIAGSSLPPKDDASINPYDALTNSGAVIKQASMPPPLPPQPPAPPKVPAQATWGASIAQGKDASHPTHGHPRVPDFSSMKSSSDRNPVLSVHPDNALNPKVAPQANSNQSKAPFVINEVSARPQQTPPGQQSSPSTPAPANPLTTSPQANPQSHCEKPAVSPPAVPNKSSAKQLPAPIELDRDAVDDVFKSLSNPETGLLNHGSLLFFVVREFSRYQCNNDPFSLIIMEMNVMISGSVGARLPRPLPPRGVRAAAEKIVSLTRQLDLFSHYEQTDYALLLPATTRQQAAEFALSVSKALLSKPLLPDMEPKSLILHMGVASFPEDTSHPGILLAAARDAKAAAHEAGKPIILFADT